MIRIEPPEKRQAMSRYEGKPIGPRQGDWEVQRVANLLAIQCGGQGNDEQYIRRAQLLLFGDMR